MLVLENRKKPLTVDSDCTDTFSPQRTIPLGAVVQLASAARPKLDSPPIRPMPAGAHDEHRSRAAMRAQLACDM